jgi:DhnA family fructose-bisphosphate aldolase class Ia
MTTDLGPYVRFSELEGTVSTTVREFLTPPPRAFVVSTAFVDLEAPFYSDLAEAISDAIQLATEEEPYSIRLIDRIATRAEALTVTNPHVYLSDIRGLVIDKYRPVLMGLVSINAGSALFVPFDAGMPLVEISVASGDVEIGIAGYAEGLENAVVFTQGVVADNPASVPLLFVVPASAQIVLATASGIDPDAVLQFYLSVYL